MQKLLTSLNRVDWVLGFGTIAAGVYFENTWLMAGGVLSLAIAWYKPAERIKNKLEKKFIRKKAVASDAHIVQKEDEFYAQLAQEAAAEGAPAQAEASKTEQAPNFGRGLTWGTLYLSHNKHNQVKVHHLDLSKAEKQSPWV